MEKLLSSRSLKKDADQRWEPPAGAALLLTIAAMAVHVSVPPDTEYESIAAFGGASFLCSIAAIAYCWARLTSRLGLCPSIYHSTVLKPVVKERSIRFQVVPGVYLSFFSGLCTLASVSVVSQLCRLQYEENVVPMLLVLLAPVLTALCAYIICKEGLTLFQVLGVLAECAGLITAALSVGGAWDWTSAVIGGAGISVITARCIFMKITQEVRFDPTSATVLDLLTAGLVSAGVTVYAYTEGLLLLDSLTLGSTAVRVVEALAWVSAAYAMNVGLYRGPAALVLSVNCMCVGVFVMWLHPGWNSELLSGVALAGLGVLCYLCLDGVLAHTAVGRALCRPKKSTQRDSFTSTTYIRLIDR